MNTLVRIEEARGAWNQAIERMTEAAAALENAPTDADGTVIDGLAQAFADAEAEAERGKQTVDRLERIAKARSEVYRTQTPVSGDGITTSTEGRSGGGSTTTVRVGREPLTYEQRGQNSFFGDLMVVNSNVNAAERLKRHQTEMAYELRDVTTATGSGSGAMGDFVPPVWLTNLWIDIARAGRVTANLGQRMGPPPQGDTISIPRLIGPVDGTHGPDVGFQASQNSAVTEVDARTGNLTINVNTLAGLQDVSQQLLDRAQPGIDGILMRSLASQYALRLNQGVVSGAGTSGTIKGVLSGSAPISVTYTDATPTGAELYTSIGQAVSQVSTQRFAFPDTILMHPRRWAWLATQTDTQGRPLVVPIASYSGQNVEAENPLGVFTPTAMGLAGQMFGLPVYVDPSIPTNLGAGTNEDRIVVARTSDWMLWEDPTPRAETFRDIGSSTLTVRLRVYGYAAFSAEAYGSSTAIISGTGLAAPSGF